MWRPGSRRATRCRLPSAPHRVGRVAERLEVRTLLAGTGASVDLVTGQNVAVFMDGSDIVVQEGSDPELFRQHAGSLTSLTIRTAITSTVTVLNSGSAVALPICFEGSSGRDVFDGSLATGVLQLEGNGGNDELRGGSSRDTIEGGEGDDEIFGGPGIGFDVLRGGAGNDLILGQGGRDFLDGGTGRNILRGGGSSGDTLIAGAEGDTLFGGPGNDIVQFSTNGNVALTDSSLSLAVPVVLREIELARITITGGSGVAVSASGFSGATTMFGGSGPDTLTGAAGADYILGGAGRDIIRGNDGDDVLFGFAGNDLILAGAGDDRVFGSTGNDMLDGGAGDDLVIGQRGDDTVLSNSGADTSTGGSGTDLYAFGSVFPQSVDRTAELIQASDQEIFYRFSPGVGELNSVVGFQTLRFEPSGSTGVRFTFGGLTDVVVIGTPGNDTLHSGGGRDSLVGLGGNDQLRGRAGNDTLLGGAGRDFLAGDDTDLDAGNDILRGGGSNDEIHGGLGVDNADGNGGFDILFEQIEGSVSTYIGNTLVVDGVGTPARNFENASLRARGNGPVSIDSRGFAGNATLSGTASADVLISGDGNDNLNGFGGNDTLSSGAGDDGLSASRGGAVQVDGGPGTDHFTWGVGTEPEVATVILTDSQFTVDGVTKPATGIESASLTPTSSSEGPAALIDTTAFSGDVRANGGFGDDTIRTGSGNDTLRGGLGDDLLVAGAEDDVLTGHGGDDTLRGEAGMDGLTGGDGADRLEHDGNDVLNSDADDVIVEVMAAMMGP